MSNGDDDGQAERQYWWVNQNQTHKEELAGGFLWSPKRSARARNQFYDNMTEARPGDVVFSFYGARIQAVGIVVEPAETTPKPQFGKAGQSQNWANEGWLVGVEYTLLSAPFRPKDHIDRLRPHLPAKYSPLQTNGDGLQGVYLAELSETLAHELIDLAGGEVPDPPAAVRPERPPEALAAEETEVEALRGRTDIGAVERTQLVKARRGQGIFRANVRLNESRCRVTGVTEPAHLIASHIKPWRVCDDSEKVHGCNGLLLAPHVDHLFDRGWTSFTDQGDLLISTHLATQVLDAWGIDANINTGPFSDSQAEFLDFHRSSVFRQ